MVKAKPATCSKLGSSFRFRHSRLAQSPKEQRFGAAGLICGAAPPFGITATIVHPAAPAVRHLEAPLSSVGQVRLRARLPPTYYDQRISRFSCMNPHRRQYSTEGVLAAPTSWRISPRLRTASGSGAAPPGNLRWCIAMAQGPTHNARSNLNISRRGSHVVHKVAGESPVIPD
jgi:hypothetical protein